MVGRPASPQQCVLEPMEASVLNPGLAAASPPPPPRHIMKTGSNGLNIWVKLPSGLQGVTLAVYKSISCTSHADMPPPVPAVYSPALLLETPPIPCLQGPGSTWLPEEAGYSAVLPVHRKPICAQRPHACLHCLPTRPVRKRRVTKTCRGSSVDGRCFLAPSTSPTESYHLQGTGGNDPMRLPSVFISTDVVCHNPSSEVPEKYWKSLLVTGSNGYSVPPAGQLLYPHSKDTSWFWKQSYR